MTGQLVWLVTGCSSGLGEAIAHAVLAKGDKVIATARSKDGKSGAERLTELKSAGAAVLDLDVNASAEEVTTKAKEAWEIYGHIDVLLNNAAFIDAGIFEEIDEKMLLNSIRNNVVGPMNLTRALLPLMRERKSGTLLFMSTVGVCYGAPGANCYSGSKGLLDTLVPNLALEVAQFGIRTCMLIPGYYRTKVMTPGNILYRAPNRLPEYEQLNALVRQGCDAADNNQPGDPKKAAALIVDIVHGEGKAEGKTLPLRLPLGADGVAALKNNCEEKLKIIDEWKDIVSTTDLT